jgi:hypothetical protein
MVRGRPHLHANEDLTLRARLVPGITNPRRQRCKQVSHPTLEFTARANHVSMKVGTSLMKTACDPRRTRLGIEAVRLMLWKHDRR